MPPGSKSTDNLPSVQFVDVHTHVLPGVDDGPDSWDEAMETLRQAAQGGATRLVATPHGDARRRWDTVDSLRTLCEKLNETLRLEQVPLEVMLGMENPVELNIMERVEAGSALSLNGSAYILMELPFNQLPLYWEDVLFQIQLAGLRPIIVHPERQEQIQGDPDIVSRAVDRGVLIQVTSGSIAGGFGPAARKSAETLLKRDLVHIIASDCHRPEGHRGPDMNDGFAAAAKLVGRDKAVKMACETPMAVLQGLELPD